MKELCHRGRRLLSAVFLAVLLMVPLVERGHSHNDNDLARPCAACVVAHHAPAATASIVAVAIPSTEAGVAVYISVAAPVRRDRSPQNGRGPPSPLQTSVA